MSIRIVDLAEVPHCLPALAALHQTEWAHLNPGETLAMREQRMRGYLGENFVPTLWVAMDGDEPLGTAMIYAQDMDTHPEWSPWLASVYVREEYRRRGIAAVLVRHVMTQAKAHGVKHFYLYTPDQANYYRKLGWQPMREEIYHGEAVSIMQVDLQHWKSE